MTTIRSFQNNDLPSMRDVWLDHWLAVGIASAINVAQLEQAIVSRLFFDPELLLVAVNDQTPIAWSHTIVAENSATIAAVCTCQGNDVSIAERLIVESIQRLRSRGVDQIHAGVVRDDVFGYAGLDPIGHGVGILLQDFVTTSALRETGFRPVQELSQHIAQTACFRPPVSREALHLRRTASTRSARTLPRSARSAAGLSHIDVERFELVDRDGAILAETDFWFSDPEAEVLRPSAAILDLGPIHSRGELSSAESYLIAAVMQSLDGRSVQSIETVIDAERKTLSEQLQKICFEAAGAGVRWQWTR